MSKKSIFLGGPKSKPLVNSDKRTSKPTLQKICNKLLRVIREIGTQGCSVPGLLDGFKDYCTPTELREAFATLHMQNKVVAKPDGKIYPC